MALEKYNEKRDFKKTREPKGIKKTSKGALRFVIQKHAASHLHYDFRLEIDGVLVSWAVPKGPSANPEDKRLAMHVEDHPMGYIDFEGTIPQGEYGGGTVMVWDIGTYHAEGNDDSSKDNAILRKMHADGNIKVVLKGKKVQGSWHIVQMKGKENQWLLMKSKDEFSGADIEYSPNSILTNRDFDAISKGDKVWKSNRAKAKATPDAIDLPIEKPKKADPNIEAFNAADLGDAQRLDKFPDDWSPELATLADEPFNNNDWIFETKFDGYRTLAQIKGGQCSLVSRNGLSFNKKYPEIVKALEGTATDMILDGEVVIEDEKGVSRFQWLQNREEKPQRGTLKFYVFDILYFGSYNLCPLNLLQRKKILKAVLPKKKSIIFSEHEIGTGEKAFKRAEKLGGEGIIAKKIASKYYPGKRTKDWLKIKTSRQQEMVIGGFTEPQGGRQNLGAILCGYYEDGVLMFSGKVGSGYTESILKDLRTRLDKLEQKTSPFKNPPRERGIHWVKPELVANITFSELTETNSMRHPVYQGLRPDKKAADVTLELPQVESENLDADVKPAPKKATAKKASPKKEAPMEKPATDFASLSKKVTITHPEKIFWPKEKFTKGDVVLFYNAIADYILPYLKDRPQSLRRTPNGIGKEGFFQKNVEGMVPDWIKTTQIQAESKADPSTYLLCQNKDTLLYLVNLGCIELNPWSSRVKTLDHPDYIIFDLDPKGAPMKDIVKAAHKVKEILDMLKVPAYIKTSGGNGLHVFIPVKPKYTYDQTREFSHLVSQMVHRELPDITSLERMPDKRKGKVYLDFLQNGKGKTMASIYSLRPREGAGVSTPLAWDEITDDLVITDYNIRTLPIRLEEKGDLWKDFFDSAIDLKTVLATLAG